MSTDDNGEYNIEGALADELQLVQASQQKLYQQVEEKENEIRRLKLEQLASDLELKTLTEVSIELILIFMGTLLTKHWCSHLSAVQVYTYILHCFFSYC